MTNRVAFFLFILFAPISVFAFECVGLVGRYQESQFSPRSISAADPDYLADHVVRGKVIVPAASLLEAAIRAGVEMFESQTVTLTNVKLGNPLVLGENSRVNIQTTIESGKVRIASDRPHLSAKVAKGSGQPFELPGDTFLTVEPDLLYPFLRANGLEYGPLFRTLRSVSVSAKQANGELALDPSQQHSRHALHPTLIDGAFHALAAIAFSQMGGKTEKTATLVPAFFGKVSYWGPVDDSSPLEVRAQVITIVPDERVEYRLAIFEKGRPVLQIDEGVLVKFDL